MHNPNHVYEPCYIVVLTGNQDDEKPETIKRMDHNNPHHREWLQKHIWWAMRNNKVITQMTQSDYETQEGN